jgi:catechol 2,3-dioxygenase-like lactoylglutathione lyase family enzyme
MFKDSPVFSGFSVDDLAAAKVFYGDTLGVEPTEEDGMLRLHLGSGATVLVYPKANHEPATYTVLNFPTADVEAAGSCSRVPCWPNWAPGTKRSPAPAPPVTR